MADLIQHDTNRLQIQVNKTDEQGEEIEGSRRSFSFSNVNTSAEAGELEDMADAVINLLDEEEKVAYVVHKTYDIMPGM